LAIKNETGALGGHRLPAVNNECGYFRDQVNDGCSSGSLSGKSDFGFFPLNNYQYFNFSSLTPETDPRNPDRKRLPGCSWREGIFTKEEFLEMVKVVDRKMKRTEK
jgi:hypothetical protein